MNNMARSQRKLARTIKNHGFWENLNSRTTQENQVKQLYFVLYVVKSEVNNTPTYTYIYIYPRAGGFLFLMRQKKLRSKPFEREFKQKIGGAVNCASSSWSMPWLLRRTSSIQHQLPFDQLQTARSRILMYWMISSAAALFAAVGFTALRNAHIHDGGPLINNPRRNGLIV